MKGDTKTRLDDLVFFNRQLASIVRTQFPLPEGLRTISKEMKDKNFRRAIEEMERDVSFGIPLSQAIAKQTAVFPSLYANMIKAGEDSGNLASILDELCEYSQALYELERSVKVALYYPKIVGSFVLLFFMFVYNPLYYHIITMQRLYESPPPPLASALPIMAPALRPEGCAITTRSKATTKIGKPPGMKQ